MNVRIKPADRAAPRLRPVIAPVAAALLLAGCVTASRHPLPLSARRIARLEERARPAGELGIHPERPDASLRVLTRKDADVPLYAEPFEPVRFPIVTLHINGKRVLALIDTGSTSSVIEYGAALRTRVTPVGPPLATIDAQGIGGPTEQFLCVAKSVAMDGIELRDVPFGILNDERGLTSFWWTEGFRIEAILGNNVLRLFASVTVDLPHRTLRIGAAKGRRPAAARVIAEADLIPNAALPIVMGSVGAMGSVPILLDTGADFGFWIPCGLAVSNHLRELNDTTPVRMGGGFGAATVFKPVADRFLRLGPAEAGPFPTVISMLNYGDKDPPYVLLGRVLLQEYVVTIDYAGRKLTLESP